MGNFICKNNVTVFDFDDTLFPTSFFERYNFVNVRRRQLPRQLIFALPRLEREVIDLLREARRYGAVKIVSNGSTGWLAFAIQEYMPGLENFLARENIEVLSARDLRRPNVTDAVTWKYDVFRIVLREAYFSTLCPCSLKFISIGDGEAERQATLALPPFISAQRTRIVKLQERPTFSQLITRVMRLRDEFANVVRHNGHLDAVLF